MDEFEMIYCKYVYTNLDSHFDFCDFEDFKDYVKRDLEHKRLDESMLKKMHDEFTKYKYKPNIEDVHKKIDIYIKIKQEKDSEYIFTLTDKDECKIFLNRTLPGCSPLNFALAINERIKQASKSVNKFRCLFYKSPTKEYIIDHEVSGREAIEFINNTIDFKNHIKVIKNSDINSIVIFPVIKHNVKTYFKDLDDDTLNAVVNKLYEEHFQNKSLLLYNQLRFIAAGSEFEYIHSDDVRNIILRYEDIYGTNYDHVSMIEAILKYNERG